MMERGFSDTHELESVRKGAIRFPDLTSPFPSGEPRAEAQWRFRAGLGRRVHAQIPAFGGDSLD
jgi:hypothetical protein